MKLILLVFVIAAATATAQQPASTSVKETSAKGSIGEGTRGNGAPEKADAGLAPPPANATTYTYDALGRLVQSDVTTDGATVHTRIDYDPAGNRTSYTVTGANRTGDDTGDGAAVIRSTGVVVVPLNGFTIIPLDADS
jgi:YD repeat-containing protein